MRRTRKPEKQRKQLTGNKRKITTMLEETYERKTRKQEVRRPRKREIKSIQDEEEEEENQTR